MKFPPDSIRVLDLSQGLAGAMTSLLLADQGADVICFRQRTAGDVDTPRDAVIDRHKRCVHFVEWNQENQAAAAMLLGDADVLIEDGTLGLPGSAVLRPDLVRLRIRGYSEDDSRAAHPLRDGLIGAATALFTDISLVRSILRLPPVYTALPLPSAYAAAHGAMGIVAALMRRRCGQGGDELTVTLAASALSSMGVVIQDLAQPARYDTPPLPPAPRLALGLLRKLARFPFLQKAAASVGRAMLPPLLDAYRCSDGRLLYIVAMDHARHAPRLLDHLGLRDTMRAAGMDARPLYAEGRADNICEAALLSPLRKRKLRKAIAAILQTRPAADWETELNARGVPCAVIRSSAEWLQEAAAQAAGLVMDIEDPLHGAVRQPGPAITVGEPAQDARRFASRELVAASDARWKSAPAARVAAGQAAGSRVAGNGLPLAGVKVLDLACVIAGPTCGRTLAELGADVIKIDAPDPLHGPRLACLYGMDVNHGKRSVLIDLKQSEGRAIFQKLASEADVIVHNYSAEAFASLDLMEGTSDMDHLIWCRISAFAGTQPGPRDGWRGYDPVLQAATGIMARYGSPAQPELHGVASCVDYLTGYLAAYACVLALYARHDGRVPTRVGASLAQAAQFIQLPMFWEHAAQRWDEPAGQGALGSGLHERLYEARDGWFFLSGKPEDLLRYGSQIMGLAALDADSLGRYFKQRTHDEVQASLKMCEVWTELVADAATLRQPGSAFMQQGLIQTADHPVGTRVTRVVPRYLQSSQWRLREGEGFAQPGADMREVLTAAGYSAEQIDAWGMKRTVASRWCEAYLPA
jgi:crotonobetainyl-CoA:carnitine CoA-transferase CaiB-like acyl-CoA transferase